MDVSRRQFLRCGLIAASTGGVASLGLFDDLFHALLSRFNGRKYSTPIAQALATEEGQAALAQAMVEPIRRSLNYQAIGRKLLMVDDFPS